MRKTVHERFWTKVDFSDLTGCWEWAAHKNGRGYGRFKVDGKSRQAHRVAWFLTYGVWPSDTIDHLCRNRSCVRVDHMDVVSHRENVLRGISPTAIHARKVDCPKGHPYDGVDYLGRRICTSCIVDIKRKYYLENREKILARQFAHRKRKKLEKDAEVI